MKRKFTSLVLFAGFLFILCFRELRKTNYNETNGFSTTSKNESSLLLASDASVASSTPIRTKSIAEIAEIRQLIKMHNENQKVFNHEMFGPITNETVLITIQVHNRITYLSHLIETLRTSHDITQALLIISHDVYDDAINELIQSIGFCMVIQIFYPYSVQVNPTSFPGDDPMDCPRDVTIADAKTIKCHNHLQPDMHGHYREAKFTQMKHHWWWKLNRIFDQLEVTKHLDDSYLLLLEEDYLVAEDFIPVMKLLQQRSRAICANCSLISLGTYSESIKKTSYDVMDIHHQWLTNKHNMGMIFNKTTWRSIKKCAHFFCDYDEYNYDYSLQNLNLKCLKPELFVAIIRGPRVFHIGECGVHHKKKDCKIDEKVEAVKKQLKIAKKKKFLFPTKLKEGKIVKAAVKEKSERVPYGGWGDERDRRLCFNMTLHA